MSPSRIRPSFLTLAALAVLGIYLFATRPEALADGNAGARDVPVETLLRLLDAENAAIRKLYTGSIVTPGLKQGLKFDEQWKSAHVEAGPLPALMLRETASRLQQRIPEITLFLGSEYPIEASNRFSGAQQQRFAQMERNGQPQFFRDAGTARFTAMFPDIASAEACVSCHNDHPNSPRKDWRMNDMMGATTWSYPRETLTTEEMLRILAALRWSALDTYRAYVDKAQRFRAAPLPRVDAQWPSDCAACIPSAEVFRAKVERLNSAASLNLLLTQVGAQTGPKTDARTSTHAPAQAADAPPPSPGKAP